MKLKALSMLVFPNPCRVKHINFGHSLVSMNRVLLAGPFLLLE